VKLSVMRSIPRFEALTKNLLAVSKDELDARRHKD